MYTRAAKKGGQLFFERLFGCATLPFDVKSRKNVQVREQLMETGESDQTLLKQHAANDSDGAAFEEIVRRHQSWMLKCAFTRLRDYPEAAAQVNEVFFKLADQAAKVADGGGDIKPWLSKTLKHQLIDLRRARESKKNRKVLYVEELDRDVPSPPDAQLVLAEFERVLEHAKWEHREILRRIYRDGFSVAEVASEVGCAEKTIRRKLNGALNYLRRPAAGLPLGLALLLGGPAGLAARIAATALEQARYRQLFIRSLWKWLLGSAAVLGVGAIIVFAYGPKGNAARNPLLPARPNQVIAANPAVTVQPPAPLAAVPTQAAPNPTPVAQNLQANASQPEARLESRQGQIWLEAEGMSGAVPMPRSRASGGQTSGLKVGGKLSFAFPPLAVNREIDIWITYANDGPSDLIFVRHHGSVLRSVDRVLGTVETRDTRPRPGKPGDGWNAFARSDGIHFLSDESFRNAEIVLELKRGDKNGVEIDHLVMEWK